MRRTRSSTSIDWRNEAEVELAPTPRPKDLYHKAQIVAYVSRWHPCLIHSILDMCFHLSMCDRTLGGVECGPHAHCSPSLHVYYHCRVSCQKSLSLLSPTEVR